MAIFAADDFDGSPGTNLTDRGWVKHATAPGNIVLSDAGRARSASGSYTRCCYLHPTPAPGDTCAIEVDLRLLTLGNDDNCGVFGYMDQATGLGYGVLYQTYTAYRRWLLTRIVAGGSWFAGGPVSPQELAIGTPYRVRLELAPGSQRLLVDGVERLVWSDTAISGPGHVGLFATNGQTSTNTTGSHLDNFAAATPDGPTPELVLPGPLILDGPLPPGEHVWSW